MAYEKQTWVDWPNTSTPVEASRLNHMEQGIYEASMTGGSGTHIFYKNESETRRYFKIFEYTDNQYSYWLKPITIKGTSGFFGNSFKKNFDILIDLRATGSTGHNIIMHGVVSNDDVGGSVTTTHADIIAVYNNGITSIYVYCINQYSYVDAVIYAERGNIFTDSSAVTSITGTQKSKLSDLKSVDSISQSVNMTRETIYAIMNELSSLDVSKQNKLEIDSDGYIDLTEATTQDEI